MNKKVRITIRDWENVGYCFLLLFGGIMMLYNSFAVGDKLGTIFFGGLSFLFLFFGFVFLYIENENKYIIEVSGRVVKHG